MCPRQSKAYPEMVLPAPVISGHAFHGFEFICHCALKDHIQKWTHWLQWAHTVSVLVGSFSLFYEPGKSSLCLGDKCMKMGSTRVFVCVYVALFESVWVYRVLRCAINKSLTRTPSVFDKLKPVLINCTNTLNVSNSSYSCCCWV